MDDLQKWLNERTFHHRQFRDLDKLVELKQKKRLSISVCFPTLNEEKTVGKSVVMMKSELMDRYPLVDEIAVIDSGSTDKTVEIASEFGADTYVASEYLSEEGDFRGKGENLWKALYLLKGDVIVFIDADIANIHHRFVYGLVGPLLTYPEIKFVKALYERPFNLGDNIHASGGGRVTEILVRPLFSQFFPDLSVIVQPLSGEYAGYREIFEEIPFPVGYGVETGMLIDIYQKWGLDIMAQTDLDQRVHRNQEIAALGKMSFGILQTFWNRLHKYKQLGPVNPESYMLKQIIKEAPRKHDLKEILVEEKERPPMVQVQAYQKRKKKRS
jgi:glucosyl-3-phosphoglycerate synthase